MSLKIPGWLTAKIRIPGLGRKPPSAWELRIVKALRALGLVLVASLVVWRLMLAHDVSKALAAIRAAGLPANGKELDRWYTAVPDNQNAALVLTQAFALLRHYPDERAEEVRRLSAKFPKRGEPLSQGQIELLRGYVETNAAALAKANDALRLPASRFPADFSLLASTPLPHLAHVASLAELNRYKAALTSQAGDLGQAPAAIETILGLARTLDNEPCLISQLARLKCLKLAVATLERRLNAGGLNPGEITNLVAAFARTGATNHVAHALIGERAMFAAFFQLSRADAARVFPPPKDGDEDAVSRDTFPRKRPLALRLIGYFDLDLRYFLRAMETNISFAAFLPPACLGAVGRGARAGEEARRRNYLLSSSVLPGLAFTVVREVEGVVWHRLATTALALEQFKTRHGRFPEELDELTPDILAEVPEDPFVGWELAYRRTEKGYLLYSVGRDRQDNEGLEESEKKKSSDGKSFDLTFIVQR